MNGLKSSSWLAGCLAACAAVTGCQYASYNDLVDPCWPERYNCAARAEVTTPFGTQASNGLVLDQTVWNYHFKEGKDELNMMGQDHLQRLARRRPGPVPEVFVQTATDVRHDPARAADQNIAARNDIDGKRMKAVTDYLSSLRPDVPFKVGVHNPSPVGLNGLEATTAVGGHFGAAKGTISAGVSEQNAAARTGEVPVFTQSIQQGPAPR